MTTPGYMPASQLLVIVGSSDIKAYKPTAYMYERLWREGVRTNHGIDVAEPGGGYRSYADLVDIQRQWLGKSHNRDWHLNPGSGAMPSLYSVHGLGRCLDFTGDVYWVKQVALDWGLTFPLVYLGDTNHGQHDGKTRGASEPYPYEWKRLQAFFHVPVTGKKTAAFSKALRERVHADGRDGKPYRSHISHYLNLEAAAKAKA